jgi:hypothetical protein
LSDYYRRRDGNRRNGLPDKIWRLKDFLGVDWKDVLFLSPTAYAALSRDLR